MSAPRIEASAVVIVKVRVELAAMWGDDCSVGQVHRQAVEEATGLVRRLIKDSPAARVVGEPEVSAVIADRRPA